MSDGEGRMMGAYEEIRDRARDEGVEFIYAMFVEMHGKPCAKMVPVGESAK